MKTLLKNFLPNLPNNQLEQLTDYLLLLSKWNKAFNLTAITEPEKMVTHHILDSLSIKDFLHGDHILDVGTGAGLPGIPLAIVFPEKQFMLLDSNGKKTRFLHQVKVTLGLENVLIAHERVENYKPEKLFSTIISRAFAHTENFAHSCKHLKSPDGIFLAMKGEDPTSQLTMLNKTYKIDIKPLKVAGLNANRHLVILREWRA